jgi:hypothetical protein
MRRIKNFKDFLSEASIASASASNADQFSNIVTSHIGIRETGPNSGPEVNKILSSVGMGPGRDSHWCMAFVYYVFNELCKAIGKPNPLPKTAGVIDHWSKGDNNLKITIAQARSNPSLVKPGSVFFMHREGVNSGKGHTGIVLGMNPSTKEFVTVEGNQSDTVKTVNRKLSQDSLIGFIDYFKDSRSKQFDDALIAGFNKGLGGSVARIATPSTSYGSTSSGSTAASTATPISTGDAGDQPVKVSGFFADILTGLTKTLNMGSGEGARGISTKDVTDFLSSLK